MFGVKIFGNKF